MLNFSELFILILSKRGTRSRKAAFLTSPVLRDCGTGSGIGCSRTGAAGASGAAGAAGAAGASGAGVPKLLISGIFIDSSGAIGAGASVTVATFGSGNGPTGSSSSPVSPSGTEEGAATGSEKTGSMLVVLVISSIAFCKSLSTLAGLSIV